MIARHCRFVLSEWVVGTQCIGRSDFETASDNMFDNESYRSFDGIMCQMCVLVQASLVGSDGAL